MASSAPTFKPNQDFYSNPDAAAGHICLHSGHFPSGSNGSRAMVATSDRRVLNRGISDLRGTDDACDIAAECLNLPVVQGASPGACDGSLQTGGFGGAAEGLTSGG
jgi:hypothetical protein